MTPQQAWELINRATAMLQLNRQETLAVIQAMEVLKPVTKEQEAKDAAARG